MDMILVDWTRMGKTYCLAGVVPERGYRVVRPLLKSGSRAPVRNVGWFPHLLEGHARWEVFELIRAEPASVEPPHVEDCWVRAMRSRRRQAALEERRRILIASTASEEVLIFGVPLVKTHMGACVPPAVGIRSLATIVVPSNRVVFGASMRQGAPEPDVRVTLPVPGAGDRTMPVKDHHLLLKAEHGSDTLAGRVKTLGETVRAMGADVAVRLGLSIPGRRTTDRRVLVDGRWLLLDVRSAAVTTLLPPSVVSQLRTRRRCIGTRIWLMYANHEGRRLRPTMHANQPASGSAARCARRVGVEPARIVSGRVGTRRRDRDAASEPDSCVHLHFLLRRAEPVRDVGPEARRAG